LEVAECITFSITVFFSAINELGSYEIFCIYFVFIPSFGLDNAYFLNVQHKLPQIRWI